MSSILFVSEDADARAVASRVLREAGWRVSAVAHGGHAVLACAGGRSFDVLVVDERAHEPFADRLLRQVRRDCPRIQLVTLRDRHAAGASRQIAVVHPFTADDLIRAVRSAAAGVPV